MSSDFIFRKASFGGFNRDDVISYINNMKLNEDTLRAQIAKKDNLISELNEKIACNQNETDQIKKEYEEKIIQLNESHINEIESIKNEYEEKIQNGPLDILDSFAVYIFYDCLFQLSHPHFRNGSRFS